MKDTSAHSDSPRILVADDDFASRELLLRLLRQFTRAEVYGVRDGTAAVQHYLLLRPRITLRDVPDQVKNLIPDDPLASALLKPFTQIPQGIPAPERERLTREAVRAYQEQAAPAFRKLHRYLSETYVPAARESIAISALPDGRAWDDCREEVADLMIATVDKHAPGFAASVMGRQLLSPLDLERRFGRPAQLQCLARFCTIRQLNCPRTTEIGERRSIANGRRGDRNPAEHDVSCRAGERPRGADHAGRQDAQVPHSRAGG